MSSNVKRLILEMANSSLKLTSENCNDETMLTANYFYMLVSAKKLRTFYELKN